MADFRTASASDQQIISATLSGEKQGERILIYTKHPTWYYGINTLTEKEISHSSLPNEAET